MKFQIFFISFLICLSGLAQEPSLEEAKEAPASTSSLQLYEDGLAQLSEESKTKPPQEFYVSSSQLWENIAKDLKKTIETPSQDLSDALSDGKTQEPNKLNQWHEEIGLKFILLKKAGSHRAKALEGLRSENVSLFRLDSRLFERIFLEVTLIPYTLRAYFYEKSYWLLQNLNKGWMGLLYLAWEVLILLLLLIIPVVFFKFSGRLDKKIDQQKKKSFYHSFRSTWHRNLTFILSIVSVYVPWIFSLAAIVVIEQVLSVSQFQEIAYLLPYFRYYIYYKIFRATLEIGLQEFASNLSSGGGKHLNKKVKETSRTLGLFLLFIYSMKTAFHSILGESLIFLIIEPFFGLMILALLFFVSSRWTEEVRSYLKDTNLVYLKKFSDLMSGQISYFLAPVGLLVVLIHYFVNKLVLWSSQFEFVKLIYAKVLRVKFESSRGSKIDFIGPSDEYQKVFAENIQSSLHTATLETDFFKKIDSQLSSWLDEKTNEQTVAIFGNKGSGKSFFITQYQDSLEGRNLSVKKVEVPPRVFTEKSFDNLFSVDAGLSLGSSDDKQVVFVDNAHNLFLSTIGGFEVYKKFLQLIEENKNIFWVVCFNEYSWQFLNSVLGKNQYFRLELRMPRWTVDQVREFISETHKNTGVSLEYDQIFRSSQKLQEGVASAENRFFYLLWERCAGSPGLAITYWYRSLRQKREKHYVVSLPRENEVNELAGLHQEMHFIYASLMKHENLNVSEAARSTHLPRSVVKQAVFRGMEEGFLVQNQGRYTISMNWIDDIKKHLKGKNLIYDTH